MTDDSSNNIESVRTFIIALVGTIAALAILGTIISLLSSLIGGPVQNEADRNNSEELQIVLDRNFEGIENVEVYAYEATITVADDRVDSSGICTYALDAANGYTYDFIDWQGSNGGILDDTVALREATVTTGGWFADETECEFSRS